METWTEIESYVTRRFRHRARRDGYSVAVGKTVVAVRHAKIAGLERLVLAVVIAPEAEISARAALDVNAKLRVGALVLQSGKLIYRHTMVIGRFDVVELDKLLDFMGRLPARLQPQVRGLKD
jgi:hypothetical protein